MRETTSNLLGRFCEKSCLQQLIANLYFSILIVFKMSGVLQLSQHRKFVKKKF